MYSSPGQVSLLLPHQNQPECCLNVVSYSWSDFTYRLEKTFEITAKWKPHSDIYPQLSPYFIVISPCLSQKMPRYFFFAFPVRVTRVTRALCSDPPGARQWRGRWGSRTSAPLAARRCPRTAARARCGRPPRRGNPGLSGMGRPPGWGPSSLAKLVYLCFNTSLITIDHEPVLASSDGWSPD